MPEASRSWTNVAAVALLPLLALMHPAQAEEKARLRAADVEALAFLALAPVADADVEAKVFAVLRETRATAAADLRPAIAAAQGRNARARFIEAYSGVVASRLAADTRGADGDLHDVAFLYIQLASGEARADTRLAMQKFRGSLAAIDARQKPADAVRVRAATARWLVRLRTQLRGLSGAELEMIGLQSLVAQRQMVIQLATRLIGVLDDAARTVAGNMGGGGGGRSKGNGQGSGQGQDSGSSGGNGGSGGGSVDYGGCLRCSGGLH